MKREMKCAMLFWTGLFAICIAAIYLEPVRVYEAPRVLGYGIMGTMWFFGMGVMALVGVPD